MADLQMKKSAYVSRLIQRTINALDTLDSFVPLRREWDEMGYGPGSPNEITEDDLVEFAHLTPAKLSSLMTTIDAVAALRAAGHGTNLQNIRP